MGLGKTLQALALLSIYRAFPVLIVVPASLRLVWAEAIERWLPELSCPPSSLLVIFGSDDRPALPLTTASGVGDLRSNPDRERCKDSSVNLPGDEGAHDDSSKTPSQARGGPTFVPWPTKSSGCPASRLRSCPSGTGTQVIASDAFQCRTGSGSNSGVQVFPGDDSCHTYRGSTTEEPSLLRATATTFSNEEHRKTGSRQENQSATSRCEIKVARVSTVGARVGGPVHTAAATQPSASSHCSSLSSAVTPSPSCSAPAWAAPKIVLISYEMCRRLPDFLAQMNFRMVIVDESHKLRTPASAGVVSELEADTTRRVLQLIKAATYAVLLSGTPSVKHPFDLFSQIDALRPPMEPHSWRARQQRVRQEWSALVGATRKHHFEGEERTEGEECHVEEKGAANRTDTWRSVKAEEGELVDDAVRVAETAEVRTGELPDLPDAKSRLYGQEGNILRADRIQFGEEYCTCVTTFGSRKRYGISPRSWELHLLLKTAVLIRRTKLAPRPSGSPNSKECSSTEGESAAGATSQLAPVTGDAVKPQNAVTQQVPRERIATLAVKPLERRVASPECHGGTQVDVNSQRKSRVGDARYGAEGGDHAKGELAVERAAAHFDGRPKREGAGEDEPLAERGGGDGAEKEGAFLGAAGEVESVADCQAVAPPCVRILQGLHLCRENRAVRAIAAAAVLMRPGFEMLLDFVKEEHEKQKEEEKVSMLEQTRRELKIPLRKGTRARGVNAPGKKRKLREEEKRETGKNSAQHENGETNGREHEPKVEISEKDNVENCIEGQPNAIEGRRLVVNVEEAAGGTTKGCDGSPEGKGGAPSRSRRRQRDSDPAGKPSAQDEDLRSSSTVRATGSARKETEGETPGTPMCAQGEGGSCDMLVADDRSKEEQEGTCGRSQEQQERFSNAVARLSQELVGGVDRWFVKTEAERVGLSKVQSAMQWLEEKFLRDSVFEGDGEKESSYTKIVVFAHHRRVLDSAEVELRRIQRKMSRLRIHFPAGHSTKTRSAKGGRNEEADRSSEARQGDQGDLSTQQGARFAFEFVRIDGSSAEDEKLRRRERFARNPSCKVALLSVTASSHGVDLSNANVCVFLELLPDQHELLQAEGRLHRRGQCRQVVTFFLINKLIGPLGGPLEARCDPARGEDEEERQTEGQQCKERDQGGDEGSRGAKGKGRQNRRCAGNPVASRGANGKADAMNKVCDGDEWVSQCSDSSEDIPSPPLLCESGTLLPGTGKSGSSSSCCPLSVLRRFRKAVRRETARLFAECERADLCAWQRYSTCAAAVHHVVDGPVRAAEGDAFPLRIDSQAEWTGKPGDREQGNQGDVSTRSGAVAREMVSSSGDGEHSRETENLCVSPTDFGEEAAAALASRTAESGGLRNGEDRPFMQAHESPGATSMELNENSRVSSGTIEEVLAMEDKQAENRQDLRGISFTAGHRESGKFTPETPSAETGVVPGDRKHVASARVCTVVNVKSSRCGSPTGLFHPEDLRFIVSSYTKRLHLLRVIRCRREFHTGAAASEVFQGATASSFHPTAKPFCPMFTSDGTHFLGDSKPHLSDVRAEDSSTPLSAESLTVKPIGVSFPAEELISFAAESSLFDSGADPLSPGIFGSYACLEHQEQNSEKIPSMNCLGQGARGIPTTPADEGEDGEAVSVPQCSRTKDFMFSVERANKSNRSEETASETQKSGDSHHLYCGWDLQSVAQQRTAKENQGCTPSLRQWAAVFYREYLSLTSYQRRRIRRSYAPLGLRAWLATAPEFCSPPGRGSAQTLSSSILLSSPSFLECGRPACPSLQFSPSPAFCSFGSSEQRGNNDDEDTRGQACGGNIAPRDRIQWPRTDSAQVPLSEPPSSAPSLPSTTLKAPRFLRDLPEKALAGGWGGVADFLCVGASQSSRQETSPERKPVVSKYYAANLPKPPGRGGRKRHASEIAASRKTEDEGKPSESLVGGTNFAACVGGRTSFRATPDTGERGQAQETQKQNVSRAALLSVDEPVAVVRGVAGAKKRRTQRATRTCSRKQGKKRDEAPAAAVTSGELPAPPRQQPKKPKKPYARTRREASEVTLCLRWDEDEEEPHELADFCRCLLKEAHSGGFHSGEVVCATSDLPLVDAGPDCGASRKECLLQKRNYRWSSNFGMVASRWWSKITTEQERSTYLSAEQVGAVQHGDRNLREHSPRSRASPFTASTDKMQEKKRTGCLSFFPDRDEVRHVESRNGPVVGTGCRVNTHGSETGHNTASVSLSGYHSTDFHSPSSLSMSGDSLTHSLTLSGDAQGVRVLSQSTAPTCVGETTDTSVGEALSCSLPPPPLGCLAATTFNAPQFPVSASSASSSPCPIPSLPVLQQASTAPTVSPCSIGSRFDGGVTAVLQKHEGAERDSHKIFFVRALVSYNRLGASPVTYYQPMSYRSDMPHEVSALPKDAVSAPRSCPFQPLCMMCYRPLLAVSTTRRWLNISTESASGGQVCLGMSEDPSVCGGRKRRNRSRSRASDSTRSGEPVASADSGESGNGKENKGRQRQRRTPVVSKCVAGEFSSGCREGPAFDLPSAVEICRQSERAALSGEVVVQNESVRSRTRGQRRHGASESREKLVGAVQRQCTVIKASGEPGQTKPGLGPGEGREARSNVRAEEWEVRCTDNDLFCSGDCRASFFALKNHDSLRRQIFRSDRGVCSSCGVDCIALLEGVRARKETNQRVSAIAAFICSFAPTFTAFPALCALLIREPVEGNAWHADHIIPVHRGGGLCGLTNIQTLCRACHQMKTNEERKARHIMEDSSPLTTF
ncbi:swi2 snf2-containing protein [Cystoisospora suis]|uniref:Swi2 snf2-containing protein n=1 Tax=Cystoisospora suis TaxID=483139 RepID=A0A2C6LFT1_9APIC|nr:swi2 snf2-containing protein [Cystoisospora suis]